MTVNIAFLCTDGVVLAADSMLTTANERAPFGTGKGISRKLHAIGSDKLFTWSGEQGQAGRLRMYIELLALPEPDCPHVLNHMLTLSESVLLSFEKTRSLGLIDCEAFLAFPYRGQLQCCAFKGAFQPCMMDADNYYMALGTGKQLADPFLKYITDLMCPRQPTVREAIFLSYWTILHVINSGPGGVDHPIRIGTLTSDGAEAYVKVLGDTEIDDQQQAVAGLQDVLRKWRDQVSGSVEAEVSPPPQVRPRDGMPPSDSP